LVCEVPSNCDMVFSCGIQGDFLVHYHGYCMRWACKEALCIVYGEASGEDYRPSCVVYILTWTPLPRKRNGHVANQVVWLLAALGATWAVVCYCFEIWTLRCDAQSLLDWLWERQLLHQTHTMKISHAIL
jgi:hypothetical protein